MCSCASFSCSLSFLLDGKKVYKFEQDRRCDRCHHGKHRVARASECFPPSGRKMFTHLLYSFLSLLLDLYELKAEPIFSFCWVISEQSLRALKYKSLWTVFSCEWSVPHCDTTKEIQARARFDKPIRFNFRHCHLSASEFITTAIIFVSFVSKWRPLINI